nr:hypothetical protein [uncultured Cohaesibacter sp.]
MTKAIAIEKLIEWTYAIECAHRNGEVGKTELQSAVSGSSWAAIENMGILGCIVSTSGKMLDYSHQLSGYSAHTDAVAVHHEVMDIPDQRTRELIIMHGIKRTIPDPLADETVYIDPRAASGEMRIRMLYRDAAKSRDPIACKVPWRGGDLDMIAMARADYAAWRVAIDMVQERLADCQLELYRPLSSSLPLDPWNGIERGGVNNPQMWEAAETRHSHASY